MKKKYTKILLPITTGLFLLTFGFNAFATGNSNKVTICHRTDSATNPYVQITVDDDSVDGVAGNSGNKADHFGEHQGPIVINEATAQSFKDTHTEWGDIIPPVSPYHNGFNWTVQGQSIWSNNCNFATQTSSPTPSATPSPTPSVSPNPSPTPTPTVVPSPTPTPTTGGNTQEQSQTQTNNQTVNITVSGQVAGVKTPTVQPETGVSTLAFATMFGAAPFGILLGKFSRTSKRKENLVEFASTIVREKADK